MRGTSVRFPVKDMKSIALLIIAAAVLFAGCAKKKPENAVNMQGNPHAGMQMPPGSNPHAGTGMDEQAMPEEKGGLDVNALIASLPPGWTKAQPSSSMRVAQMSIAPAKGDTEAGEVAVFHFPGSGGSSAANIERWQNQFSGPKGEPGPDVAKTDTAMVGLLTIVTTDITGTQLASSTMTGEGKDKPNYRMIASVIKTQSGNWFIKAVGPVKTMTENAGKYRDLLRRIRVKQ